MVVKRRSHYQCWRCVAWQFLRRDMPRCSARASCCPITGSVLRSNGIPQNDAIIEYIELVNARDGGLNGVKLSVQECEDEYQDARGVECYERYKHMNAAGLPGLLPLSTGIAFALYDRANVDKVPIITPDTVA